MGSLDPAVGPSGNHGADGASGRAGGQGDSLTDAATELKLEPATAAAQQPAGQEQQPQQPSGGKSFWNMFGGK
jgi:hypothetical protein